MPTHSATKKPIDRSKTYLCRYSCGFETTWPAALGRHEAARHRGTVSVNPSHDNGKPAGKSRRLPASAKIDRLLEEVRKQHDEVLHALRKASLLVLAERDLRSRETEQVKVDLATIYDVLERNRQARQDRLVSLVR